MGEAPNVDTKRYLLDLAEIYDVFQRLNASQIQIAILLTKSSVHDDGDVQNLIDMFNSITEKIDTQLDELKVRVKAMGVKLEH